MPSPMEEVPRTNLPGSQCKPAHGGTNVGKTDTQQVLSVSVIVRRKQPLLLHELAGARVSREEFDNKYAGDPKDFDSLRAFAHQHGLAVDEAASSLARRTLVLRGAVQAVESAFGVTLNDYEYASHPGRRFHGYEGAIRVPAEPSGIVQAVLGLDAKPIAKPHIRFYSKPAAKSHIRVLGETAKASPQSFTPPQVAQLYSFPTGVTGAGEAIGIIELGGGYKTADLNTYFQGLGLKTPAVTAVSVDGGANTPGNPSGADAEVLLDIEVAGSVAPEAKIAVYFAPNTDQGFVDAITTALHDTANKPSVISISWGGPESSWSDQALTALDSACQSAAALGVTITAASGDSGSSDGVSDGRDHVDFPASSPHVLACGGTELIASGTQISQETVWNDQSQQGGASGGGVSQVFALPTWQANAGVPAVPGGGSTGGRGVPDVAGDAAPASGYNILVDGQQEVVGGTSAVAPLWAGLVALINQQRGGSSLGFLNPMLYTATTGFHDITQGSNGDYSAGPGWDACTGLGSPDGTQLATALGTTATGS
jgi:kumamolisin